MAKTTKRKFKEADQIIDQNLAPAAPVPATDAEVNQAVAAAPAEVPATDPAQDIVPPATEETLGEELPVEEGGVQLNPATVGVEVQIPTDQLAQAVAMATGDVTAAETAPDVEAAQADELVAAEPAAEDAAGAVPVEGPAEVGAPEVPQAQAPVLESCENKEEKIEEAEESVAVEKKLSDDLEQIIDTGVKNTADGLSNGKASINNDNKENKLDIIEGGVENTAKGLKESEDPIKDAGIEKEEEPEVEEEVETVETAGEPVEGEKLDFSKLAAEESDADLPEGMDGEFEGGEDDFEDFGGDAETDEFLAKISNFLKGEDTEEVTDALRTTADLIDALDDKEDEDEVYEDEADEDEGIFAREVEDLPEDEEEKLDFDSLLSGAYEDDDFEDEEDFEESRIKEASEAEVNKACKKVMLNNGFTPEEIRGIEGDDPKWQTFNLFNRIKYSYAVELYKELNKDEEDFEEEEEEPVHESLVRVPCKFPKKVDAINEKKEPIRPEVTRKPLVKKIAESNEGIVFPAGSEPDKPLVESRRQNLVEAHEKAIEARRTAMANYRESVKRSAEDNRVKSSRFNEALRTSVRLTERSSNDKAWSNNQCLDKYDESNRLDFKKLLDGDWFHHFG